MRTPTAVVWIFSMAVGLFLPACEHRPPVMKDFDAWWDGLSESEREYILRVGSVGNTDQYKVTLGEKEQEMDHLREFKEWADKLSPGQIEAFLIHKATAGKIDISKTADVVNRVPVCPGMLVVSSDCQHSDGVKMSNGKCLRCVSGVKK